MKETQCAKRSSKSSKASGSGAATNAATCSRSNGSASTSAAAEAETASVETAETKDADGAGAKSARRQLSCGWSFESFSHGFRVGRQLSRDGVHLVLTVDADAPAASLLPESALLELLKESGVVLG